MRTQVTSTIDHLNDQCLAVDRAFGEDQLEACAATILFGQSWNMSGSESVGQLVMDRPRFLIRAGEGLTLIAATERIRIRQDRVTIGAAASDGTIAARDFARPATARLAAVPISSGLSRSARRSSTADSLSSHNSTHGTSIIRDFSIALRDAVLLHPACPTTVFRPGEVSASVSSGAFPTTLFARASNVLQIVAFKVTSHSPISSMPIDTMNQRHGTNRP